jgi:glycosyltransferase involved in cell wall biosynthesis
MGRVATPQRSVPHVSVCVCTYNGDLVLRRAMDSILGQTHADLEVLVVDDASSDGTAEVVRSYGDSRIRLVQNAHNLGNARNRSLAIQLSRGSLVKFVDQDDWISPTCVAEHARLFDAHPRVGLTFSRRSLSLDEPRGGDARAWQKKYSDLHRRFVALDEINAGPKLLKEYVAAGLRDNWIGEPTCVMLRRTSLTRSLLFNRFLRQMIDMDLWIRVMAFCDIGFLDAELATRSIGSVQETGVNRALGRDWLDRLWLLEGLRELPEIWERYPELAQMRRVEQKSLLVALVTGKYRRRRVRSAVAESWAYVAHVNRSALGRRQSVFDRIDCGSPVACSASHRHPAP